MSTVVLNVNNELELGPTAATRVSFTGEVSGTDSLTEGRVIDTRRVPGGRGRGGSQQGKFVTHDFDLDTDANATHDQILRAAAAQRLYGQWRVEGTGSGKPNSVFEGVVARWSKTWDIATDAIRYSVGIAVDGRPTVTNQ